MVRLPHLVRGLLLPALLILAACAQPQQEAAERIVEAQETAAEIVTPAADQAQQSVAEVLVPAALAVQEAAQILTEPLPAEAAPVWPGTGAATALIVRWEITSPALYARRYEGVICPGGASGPTIGIGYDLGHQTRSTIERDWAWHPAVERLAAASGQVGEAACARYRAAHHDIRVRYADAERVFADATLPVYHAAARRALHAGWSGITPNAQAANVSMGYNRGWSMRGDRNREKRAIRDDCVPAGDEPCNAAQLRAMCRLWADTPNSKGLCGRRDDEARVAVS